jgi:hypothetical protein
MHARYALALLCAASACAGDEPVARQPEPAPPEQTKARGSGLAVQNELGTIDPEAVKRVFRSLDERFMACQKRGLERVEVLAGNVKFSLRIGADGQAKWAYVPESDLGDRATESCLVDVVMGSSWPKPDGGDAEAQYAMELPLQATRPANDWSSERVTQTLLKHATAIDQCKAGTAAPFHATMYVAPGGRVLSASVTAGGKDDQSKADCLSDLLGKLKSLPSPGSWPAKVSFSL